MDGVASKLEVGEYINLVFMLEFSNYECLVPVFAFDLCGFLYAATKPEDPFLRTCEVLQSFFCGVLKLRGALLR